ncbi:superoxide dismutase family protein [Kitasatospora sp. McL0602]|uniref:superoxide dismutase family protein n=1 Tax=Kitasatospora sp. McL0602 TaxID=3439530 RepID=UPI003F8A9911
MALLPAALLPLALLPSVASPWTVVEADFDPASAFVPPAAISYAPDLVPYGSHVHVTVLRSEGRTTVEVELTGVAAGRTFPAHAHTGRCGAEAAASGPHYQDQVDPVQPSTDPAYANDRNELRMAVRTDDQGAGTATAEVPWSFRPGEARSIVLHAGTPAGAHGPADRVACVDVDL